MSEAQQKNPEQVLKEFRDISHNATWKKLFVIFMLLILHKDQSSITDNPFTWNDLFSLILIKIIVYFDIFSDLVLNLINLPCDWILFNDHVAEILNYNPDELFMQCRHGKYRLHYSMFAGFFSVVFWVMVIDAVKPLFK